MVEKRTLPRLVHNTVLSAHDGKTRLTDTLICTDPKSDRYSL